MCIYCVCIYCVCIYFYIYVLYVTYFKYFKYIYIDVAAKPAPTRKVKPVNERFGSRTAPAPERRGARGQPSTKGGGTLTRKSNGTVAPTRRVRGFDDRNSNTNNNSFPDTAPPAIAVSGIKGVRSMKQRK